MRRCVPLVLLIVVAALAPADSWYSIDGFTVTTGESVRIETDDASPDVISFYLNGSSESEIAAFLAPADSGPLPDRDMAVLGAITVVRAMQTDSRDLIESIELSPYSSPRGIEGSWLTIFSSTGYHDAYLVRLDTPGGLVDSMIFVPRLMGGEGRAQLDALLEELEIRVEEAAG